MKKIAKAMLLLLVLIACHNSAKPVWRWTLQSRCYADPVIEGRILYVVSAAGEVIAGETRSGRQIWSQKLPGSIVAAPAVSDSMLLIATQQGHVFALEKKKRQADLAKTIFRRRIRSAACVDEGSASCAVR